MKLFIVSDCQLKAYNFCLVESLKFKFKLRKCVCVCVVNFELYKFHVLSVKVITIFSLIKIFSSLKIKQKCVGSETEYYLSGHACLCPSGRKEFTGTQVRIAICPLSS